MLHQIWTRNHLQRPELVLRIDLRSRRHFRFAKNCDDGVDRGLFEGQFTLEELYPAEVDGGNLAAVVEGVGREWWGGLLPGG